MTLSNFWVARRAVERFVYHDLTRTPQPSAHVGRQRLGHHLGRRRGARGRPESTARPRSMTSATSAARCPVCRSRRRSRRSLSRDGAPDAILIPTSYDGRDIAGTTLGSTRSSGTDERDRTPRRRRARDRAPGLRWFADREGAVHGEGPGISSCARSPSRPKPPAAHPRPWSPQRRATGATRAQPS